MTQPEENEVNRSLQSAPQPQVSSQPAQPVQGSSLPAGSVPGLHHIKGKAANLASESVGSSGPGLAQDSLAYGPLSFQGTLKHGWSTWGSGLHCTSQESLHAKEVAVPSHHINTSDQCTTPHPAWGHGFAENCSTEPYTKSSSEAILAESSSSDEALKRNPSYSKEKTLDRSSTAPPAPIAELQQSHPSGLTPHLQSTAPADTQPLRTYVPHSTTSTGMVQRLLNGRAHPRHQETSGSL